MRVFVDGVGLLAPGLNGWCDSQPVLTGAAPYVTEKMLRPNADLLPANERRRASPATQLACHVAREALLHAGRPASETATVFTSSSGNGEVIHQICETLALPEREISPTRFHNSVHNAPAGYWSIATGSRAPSTTICCHDASFAGGLLEAALQVSVEHWAVLLVVFDLPYPQPLHQVRPLSAPFGTALVLTPERSANTQAELDLGLDGGSLDPSRIEHADLEHLRSGNPAARALPLLAALAGNQPTEVVLNYVAGSNLRLRLTQ